MYSIFYIISLNNQHAYSLECFWANVSPESTILDTNVNIFSGHCRGLSATDKYRKHRKKAALQFIWICLSFEILYTLLSNQTTLWCCFIFWGNGNHIYSSSLIRVNANNYHDKTLKQAKNSWLLMCTAKNQWNRKIALFNKC